MITFDGGSGEVCQIRRVRTNTPLQALVTLNDPVFLEAAAGLAARMIAAAGDTDGRLAHGLRLALIRTIDPAEIGPLRKLFQAAERDYLANPAQAEALIRSTRAPVPDGIGKPALAAWIVVANAILNLDEFMVRH